MSILDLHAPEIEQAASNVPYRAPPEPEAKFSAWKAVTAIPRGVAEAGAQVAATGADVANALRYMRDATPEQRKEIDRGGVPVEQFSSQTGDRLRRAGEDFRSDPVTAHAAEQVVYGFARGATKVVAGAVTGGPAGVAAAGLEEAITQADELRRKGVGVQARSEAGLVQGVGLGLAALPLVGQTAAGTAALYAIGGPGGFMAQQAITRDILRSAGHDRLAEQFDPFDPVGLAVSALVPAVFTAAGIRSQRAAKAAKAAQDFRAGPVPSETTPVAAAVADAYRVPAEHVDAAMVHNLTLARVDTEARAQAVGEVRPLESLAAFTDRAVASLPDLPPRADAVPPADPAAPPAPMPSRPTAVADAVRAYPTEAVDAARVVVLAERRAASNPGAPDNLRALDQHEAALVRAEDQINAGEAVRVADVAPVPDVAAFRSAVVEDSSGRQVEGLRAEFPNGQGGMGVLDLAISDGRMYPTWVDNGLYGRGAADTPRSGAVVGLYERAIAEARARGLQFTSDDSVTPSASRVYDALQRRGYTIEQNPAAREAVPPEVVTPRLLTDDGSPVYRVTGFPEQQTATFPTWANQITAAIRDLQSTRTDAPTTPQAANPEAAAPARGAGGAPADAGAAEPGRAGAGVQADGVTPGEKAADAAVQSRLAQIEAERPDLQVMLDGMDKPMALADFLAAVKADADEMLADAPLLQVAAECALLNGS